VQCKQAGRHTIREQAAQPQSLQMQPAQTTRQLQRNLRIPPPTCPGL
jgi:hypothetical protein